MRSTTSGKIPVGRAKGSLSFPFLLFSQTIGKVLMEYADILSKNFPAYCTKEKMVRVRLFAFEALLRAKGGVILLPCDSQQGCA